MWWDKLVLRIVGVCMYHSSEGSRSEFELVYVVVIWCMGACIYMGEGGNFRNGK